MRKILLFAFAVFLFASCNLFKKDKFEPIQLFPVEQGEKWGYVDAKGNLSIPVQFKRADIFSDKLARVAIEIDSTLKYGFINEKGTIVIPCQFADATCFSEGIAWVTRPKGYPIAIDHSGNELFSLKDAEKVSIFSEGLAAFSQVNSKGQTKWGFCDKNGKVVIYPNYNEASLFFEGLSFVSDTNKKYGFIDKTGKLVINYQFDKVTVFCNGIAAIQIGEKWGLIDKKGKIILNPQFEELQIIDKNFIMVKIGEQYGFCDNNGKMIINPQFDDICYDRISGNKTVFAVQQNNKWGYVNKKGEIIINPQFDLASPFYKDIAAVEFSEKFGFINAKGTYISNPQYDGLSLSKQYFIRTQIFNPTIVVAKLDIVNHNEIPITSTFSDIMTKYNMNESDFSKYSNKTPIYDANQYSHDYTIRVYVMGSPFRKYQAGYFFTWTEYEFHPEKQIEGLVYAIELDDNAENKIPEVISEIDKVLSSYEKIDYSSSNLTLILYKSKNQSVVIRFEKDENEMYVIIGDSSNSEKLLKAFSE